MIGLWFNHGDIHVRKNPEDLESLKRFGFSDAFVLFKGGYCDQRDKPEDHKYLDFLISGLRRNDIRVHGVFYCSEDRKYINRYPEKTDISVFGETNTRRICHLDSEYIDYLNNSILTAAEEYGLDGIQLDFVRFGTLMNGWSPEEERIYSSFGVDVPAIKQEILDRYDDISGSNYNLGPIFERYRNNDGQLSALAAARRSILKSFVSRIAGTVRSELKDTVLSAAMMPEGMYPPWRGDAALHYSQEFEDFEPYFDYMVPMVYAGTFNQSSGWVGTVAGNVSRSYPGSVIGLDSVEPRNSDGIRADIEAIRGQNHAGVCFFRYGRMILSMREGPETVLYNTYPGQVTRLVLTEGDREKVVDCSIDEASWMRIEGQWERIRAFGSFASGRTQMYEGELCVLDRDMLDIYRRPVQTVGT